MTRQQRPSEDLPTLAWQLRSSLQTLADDAEGPDASDFRRFLRRAVAHGWRAAATARFDILREVINVVREARPEVDDALPKLSPRALAAIEMQQALGILHVGEDELREIELENRLSERGCHSTEREVLKVLATAERPLRQAEVHERLELRELKKPTPSRIGQILRELYEHSFTRRQLTRARGRAEVAHYLLAPRGWALCEQLGIEGPVAATSHEPTNRAFASHSSPVFSPPVAAYALADAPSTDLIRDCAQAWHTSWRHQRVLDGLIQNARDANTGRFFLTELFRTPLPGTDIITDAELARERGQFEITRDVLSGEVSVCRR